MPQQPAVLIVGAGAVGALFGTALARRGARVAVVCRSDHAAVSRNGYRIHSALLGSHVFRPERVLQSVSQYGALPDYLILTAKVLDETDRVALLRPAVGPHTVIVLIASGIDIEAPIAAAWPQHEVLSGLASMAISRVAPGEIQHHSAGSLVLGRYPEGVTHAARTLADMFEAAKISCRLTSEVTQARWQRAVWNATFNPLSIMGPGLTTASMLAASEDESLLRRAMREVCQVAAAAGYPQPERLIDQMIADTRALPPYKTSMALDFESGRPLELEATLGNVVRTARAKQIAAPTLEAVYAIARMLVRSRRQ